MDERIRIVPRNGRVGQSGTGATTPPPGREGHSSEIPKVSWDASVRTCSSSYLTP